MSLNILITIASLGFVLLLILPVLFKGLKNRGLRRNGIPAQAKIVQVVHTHTKVNHNPVLIITALVINEHESFRW